MGVIKHNYTEQWKRRLRASGVGYTNLMRGGQLDLANTLLDIDLERDSTRKLITARYQLKNYQSIEKKFPLTEPIRLGISSVPSDLKAKYLAVHLLSRQLQTSEDISKPVRWLTLLHGNKLQEQPSFLVLSNLTANSTNYRLEQARDILESVMCPIIVVVGGIDCASFFRYKMHYPINYAFHLGHEIGVI